jgi:tRNA dimethylallyltransferase
MTLLVCIIGPTGTGKSALAIEIAGAYQGEIINCDSRQVYRYMDIGTAKPSPEDLSSVKHHLISIINPDEELSLSHYQEMAYQTIDEIHTHGKQPVLVGGTGQYFWAVTEGWEVPKVPPDLELRRCLESQAELKGIDTIYKELLAVDPAAAKKIDPRNVRRVIRALEVFRSRGVPFSSLQVKKSPPFQTVIIGLTMDRSELYRRVDLRVDRMVEQGLVEEVKKLIETGYRPELPAMSGIGYKQIILYLQGKLKFDDAIQQIKFETHRYIRQQYAWFRLKDERIHWFNIGNDVTEDILKLVASAGNYSTWS